ncbi:hypothetical protein O9992_20390 [Vibrio lentus]|nr:hypothetical protein [Vibrio lentus]
MVEKSVVWMLLYRKVNLKRHLLVVLNILTNADIYADTPRRQDLEARLSFVVEEESGH